MNTTAMFAFIRKYNAPISCVNILNDHAEALKNDMSDQDYYELSMKAAIKIAYELGKASSKEDNLEGELI